MVIRGIFDTVFFWHAAIKTALQRNKNPTTFIYPKLRKVWNNSPLIKAENIVNVSTDNFIETALQVFLYQHQHCAIYRAYCDALNVQADKIYRLEDIPFLPVNFFKSHRVTSGEWTTEALRFESSGTTGTDTSKHYVRDAGIYAASLCGGFEQHYGDPARYNILALLPSYLERSNSSLVHMARQLMEKSRQPHNGFFINEWDKLYNILLELQNTGAKTLLLGVTFALLDFAETHPCNLNNIIVMETGGMKGRREEWTRQQVHSYLKQQWQLPAVHSEYGMTELLSQAYAKANGIFTCANTMKVLIRDVNDPLDVYAEGQGCINVIDLANIHSCSFIATEDIGRLQANGTFEVLGRMDHSALRGCSLMAI